MPRIIGDSLEVTGAVALDSTLNVDGTVNGGDAANDDLTLQGTSHATRTTSYVIVQPNGGNVGVGTTGPTQLVHAVSQSGADATLYVDASTAGAAQRATAAFIADGGNIFFRANGTTATGTRFGVTLADTAEFVSVTMSAFLLGTNDANPFVLGTNNTERVRILSTGIVFIGVSSGGASVLGLQAGTSTNDAAVGGVLYINSTAVGNIGAGDDDLMVYTVPANTLSANNMRLSFEAWGTYANNATVKTLKVKFGADSFTVLTSSGSLLTWHVKGRIIRTGAATQDVFIRRDTDSASNVGLTISTAARTLSSANDLKLTGTGAADNDVVQEGFIVEWADANT